MHDVRWQMVAAHRERLLRLARRRCVQPADAEDVVQEAMVRCATFADLDEARLGQFLTSVTVRLCADTFRDAERASRIVRRLAPDRLDLAGPEDDACRDAAAAALADLLERLPSRQRAVLVDRAAGLSVAQISRRHALTYKAAESALARARLTMRAALGSTFGVALAGAAGLVRRPRRAAIVAVPAAALALAGAVQIGPWIPGSPADAAPDAAPRPAGRAAPPVPAVRRPRAAAAPRSVAHPLLSPEGPKPSPTTRHPDPGLSVTDEREPMTPQEYVATCVDDGVWVRVNPELGPEALVSQGCGERPEPKPGRYDVHVDPDQFSQRGMSP